MQVPPRIEQGNITLSSIEKMASVFKSFISWVGFIILKFESNPYMRETSLLVKLIFYHMRYVTYLFHRGSSKEIEHHHQLKKRIRASSNSLSLGLGLSYWWFDSKLLFTRETSLIVKLFHHMKYVTFKKSILKNHLNHTKINKFNIYTICKTEVFLTFCWLYDFVLHKLLRSQNFTCH